MQNTWFERRLKKYTVMSSPYSTAKCVKIRFLRAALLALLLCTQFPAAGNEAAHGSGASPTAALAFSAIGDAESALDRAERAGATLWRTTRAHLASAYRELDSGHYRQAFIAARTVWRHANAALNQHELEKARYLFHSIHLPDDLEKGLESAIIELLRIHDGAGALSLVNKLNSREHGPDGQVNGR